MSISTGKGDSGKTSKATGKEVEKSSEEMDAIGALDELNSVLGIVKATTDREELVQAIEKVQNPLYLIQSDISSGKKEFGDETEKIEDRIYELEDELPPLKSFITPGSSKVSAHLHHARTVCRRAERRVVKLSEHNGLNPNVLKYLNRLSDLLFMLARENNRFEKREETSPEK